MKLELNIPESLNDITLEQYQRFVAIEEPTNDDLLSIFLDVDLNVVNQIKATEIDRLVSNINSLFEVEQIHQLRFNLNGVRYGFIPDIDNISYGENKDITTYLNDWGNMHKAMAVLYRPITLSKSGKYLIEEYKGTRLTADAMLKMPLSIVFGANVFFYNLTNALLKAIPNYLESQTKTQLMNGQISGENGEAIKKLTRSLKETLDDLTRLQSYPCISA